MVWKKCFYCCCPCLKKKKLEETTGLTLGLLNGGKWSPRTKHVPLQQLYQVHKVPRFGRAKSNDDDVASSYGDEQKSHSNVTTISEKSKDKDPPVEHEDSVESSAKHKKRWSKALALSRVKKSHGPSTPQVVTSDGEYDEEDPASRGVKHKTRWGRALLGIKKQSASKRLLSASMMGQTAAPGGNILNLPPVTVASVSSPDIVSDLMNEENEAREYMGGSNLTLRHEPDAYSLLSPFTCNWIKSQSMQTVVQGPSDGDLGQQEPEESEADKLARQHGLDPALYRVNVNLAKSTEAIDKAMKTMVDGSAPESQFIDLSYGSVQFTAVFDEAKKKLLVHVEKLESLAPKGKERSSYRCVMKLCILPFPRSSKTSKVTIDALSMFVNEYFHFGVKDVGGKVLRISVYDVAYQGVYDAIGHALFYLEDLSVEPHSMKLYQQATPDVNPGLLQLSLKYNCETEYLNVCVVKASCLNSIPTKSSVFLKVSQFYNNKKIKDQKYPSIPCDGEVEFNTNTEFRVPSNFSAKHNHVIAIRIKVKNSISKAGFTLGYVVLGPMYYAEDGFTLTPWGRALLKNETVSHTFRLVA